MYKSLVILCLLFSLFCNAQNDTKHILEYDNQDVSKILKDLENLYNVKFSYPSELILNKKITLHKSERTLDDVLFEIFDFTQIQFNKLDDTYIYLSLDDSQHLNEIIVSNYLTKGISKNKNTSFQINPKRLDLLAGLIETDILESIQQLPGVVSLDETATGLTVRGGTTDQNRIIWDNINIYHSGHLFGMVSVFNPNIAQKINFYNKGTNSKFGERISSVIDIETTKKITNKTRIEAGFNGINADVLLETPLLKNKLGLQVSIRRSYEDLIETYTFKKFEQKAFQNTKIEEEFFTFKDYNLKLNYLMNANNKLSFSLIHIDNDLENDYSEQATNKKFFDILDSENDGYSIQWHKKWSDKVNQNTNASFSNYRLNYNFITNQNNAFFSEFSKKNTISDFGFSTELNIELNQNKTLVFGYQNSTKKVNFIFKEQKDILFILDNDNSKLDTHSFYASYLYKNSKLFDIYTGLRFNYYSQLNSFRIEPRITFNKNLSKRLKLQITGEIKNQIIKQIDETVLSDLSLENKLWRLSDGKKHPIINSYQITSGLSFTKHDWTVDFDIYHKKIDGISALSLGFLNPNDNIFHIGKQKIIGFDFYAKKDFNNFKTWISYSFIDVQNKYSGLNNNQYFTSNTEISHLLSTSMSYKVKQFQFALGWKIRTGKPLTDLDFGDDGSAYFDGINTEKLQTYHRLDVSSTYKFSFSKNSHTKGKIGLSIRNIYNNKNHINTEFIGNNAIDDPIRIIKTHSIGITPNILFRVYW
jgi:hypothetical protein